MAQNFACLAGLSLETQITTVFRAVNSSSREENCLASLVQQGVSVRGKKKTTTFLPPCWANENMPAKVEIDKVGA